MKSLLLYSHFYWFHFCPLGVWKKSQLLLLFPILSAWGEDEKSAVSLSYLLVPHLSARGADEKSAVSGRAGEEERAAGPAPAQAEWSLGQI